MTPSDRYWFAREYDCYLTLGKGAQQLHDWSVWQKVCPLLDGIFSGAETGIQSAQVDAVTDRPVRFQKLRWNSESHARWTSNSPVTKGLPLRIFVATQVWAPSRKLCDERVIAPDAFLEVASYEAPAVDQGFLLAVASDTGAQVEGVVDSVARMLSPVCVAHQIAPWGETIGDGAGHTNCLQDFMTHGIPLYKTSINPEDLRGAWTAWT